MKKKQRSRILLGAVVIVGGGCSYDCIPVRRKLGEELRGVYRKEG